MKFFQSKLQIFTTIILFIFVCTITSCAPKDVDNSESAQSQDKTEESTIVSENDQSATSVDYEPYPVFQASEILSPELLKGDHHEVLEEVTNDCIWNSYTIKTDFGDYQARNTDVLEVRVGEINATAELREISGGGAIATGAVDSVINPFRSAINIATNPVDTTKGVPGGIVTFFKKVYYSGEKVVSVTGQTAKSIGGTVVGSGDEKGEGGETFSDLTGNAAYLADWYLGISGGERRIAKKLGVDPYTSNPELAAELKRVAKYDRIGRLGLGFVDIPSAPGMSYVKDVNHYVWDKDPKELREFNKQKLLEMGIDEELVEKFLDSPYYSPTFQTTIVFSLLELPKVANREEVIEDAIVASYISESSFFVNIVLLLVWYNNTQSPLKEIINHADITSGMTEDNKIVTLVPVDYLCWSEKVAEVARFHDEVFKDIDAEGRELWIVGQLSDRARIEFTDLGWEVVEQSSFETGTLAEDRTKKEATKDINKKALDVLQDGNNEIDTQNTQ